MSLIIGLYNVFSWLGLDCGFLSRICHRNGLPFSLHHIRWYMVSVWIILGYIHLDPLVKVSARFLHYKATSFTFFGSEWVTKWSLHWKREVEFCSLPTYVIWDSFVGKVCLFSSFMVYSTFYLQPCGHGYLFFWGRSLYYQHIFWASYSSFSHRELL